MSSESADVKENLVTQISELETLQAVYPDEVSVSDHGNLADINDFIEGKRNELPFKLEYDIEIKVLKGTVELLVNLPLDYPYAEPTVYCRCSMLNRNEQSNLNNALNNFMKSQMKGEPIIYNLISWLQDNTDSFSGDSSINNSINKSKYSKTEDESINFGRYWIYSHHIYSKIKRKNIVDMAKDYSLTGFSFVGKPGIICIEGSLKDCECYWQQLKVMNWHRILIKFIEKDFDPTNDMSTYKKFSDFQELCFPNSDGHNDKSRLAKFLINYNLEHAFKELFGIEAKFSSINHE
ncbi:hypothetical protein TKK_0001012 [Trichogramma kaykai]